MECGVVFSLQERLFAVPLEAAVRAVRAVAITRVPEASASASGVIDVHGEIMPVVDLCERFGLARRLLVPSAQFLLIDTGRRRVALWVDSVHGVASWSGADFVPAEALTAGSGPLKGVGRSEDGLILVQDLDVLLASVDDVVTVGVDGHV